MYNVKSYSCNTMLFIFQIINVKKKINENLFLKIYFCIYIWKWLYDFLKNVYMFFFIWKKKYWKESVSKKLTDYFFNTFEKKILKKKYLKKKVVFKYFWKSNFCIYIWKMDIRFFSFEKNVYMFFFLKKKILKRICFEKN